MGIISKDEANKVATVFKSKIVDRAATYLSNLAHSGFIGGEMTYSCEQPDDVKAAIAELTKAGWTVQHDEKTKKLIIT